MHCNIEVSRYYKYKTLTCAVKDVPTATKAKINYADVNAAKV